MDDQPQPGDNNNQNVSQQTNTSVFAVELESVSKEYTIDENPVKVLDNISLNIPGRELAVIYGPSGAGKTTLLNIISGIEKPSKGEVKVLDMSLTESDENALSSFRSANIGYVFQSYNLVSTLTAMENVELMMELAGWDDEQRNRQLAEQLISQVDLKNRANHLPSQLSGGEQQRVAIARALANNPTLILADEPTGNLDTTIGQEIVQLLTDLNRKRGKTVIITTHDDRIVKLAQKLYHIDKGQLVTV